MSTNGNGIATSILGFADGLEFCLLLINRVLFVTEAGRIRIGHAMLEADDELRLLQGAKVRFS